MKKSLILLPLLGACAATSLSGQVVYKQSFDYGASTLDFGSDLSGDGWTDNTGTIDYVPTGLSYAGITSTGGSLLYDFATPGNRTATHSISPTIAFTDPGDVYHVFALGKINGSIADGSVTTMKFDGGSAVNEIVFGLRNDAGTYSAFAESWKNGPNEMTEFGTTTVSADQTIGFLMRITQGTGSSPSNTLVEFWVNPDLTGVSLATALPASFDTSQDGIMADSKGARPGATNALDSLTFGGAVNGSYSWDEVNFIAVAVPEPSTYALMLGFVALGGVMLRRRLRG
jgi:hypothetical protein